MIYGILLLEVKIRPHQPWLPASEICDPPLANENTALEGMAERLHCSILLHNHSLLVYCEANLSTF